MQAQRAGAAGAAAAEPQTSCGHGLQGCFRAGADLHAGGGGRQQLRVEIEVGRLRHAARVLGAGGGEEHGDGEHVCGGAPSAAALSKV